RTLVIAARGEPPSIAARPLVPFSGALAPPTAIFNATLDENDEKGVTHALLAEALPQPNTDTWRVLPDGTMETTYHLRPNLTWHDGSPLTADDFVFAREVYANRAYGISGSLPHAMITDVSAPDPSTVVIRWKEPYPDAVELNDQAFAPLPRKLLQSIYERDA